MAAYLLTFVDDTHNFAAYDAHLERRADAPDSPVVWECASSAEIAVGDDVYLTWLGNSQEGIFARGTVSAVASGAQSTTRTVTLALQHAEPFDEGVVLPIELVRAILDDTETWNAGLEVCALAPMHASRIALAFERCAGVLQDSVYTIAAASRFEDKPSRILLREKGAWTRGRELFERAQLRGKRMPIVMANAASVDGVRWWGFAKSIETVDGRTEVEVVDLQDMYDIFSLGALTKLSDGEPLSDSYIRPYVPCYTPWFVLLQHCAIPGLLLSSEELRTELFVAAFRDQSVPLTAAETRLLEEHAKSGEGGISFAALAENLHLRDAAEVMALYNQLGIRVARSIGYVTEGGYALQTLLEHVQDGEHEQTSDEIDADTPPGGDVYALRQAVMEALAAIRAEAPGRDKAAGVPAPHSSFTDQSLVSLAQILERLSEPHRAALQWFEEHAGTVQPTPNALLASLGLRPPPIQPVGVLKPAWSDYAVCVCQGAADVGASNAPETRADRTWHYRYEVPPADHESSAQEPAAVQSLMKCWSDGVPVGLMRQIKAGPDAQYHVFGLALFGGSSGTFYSFEGFGPSRVAHSLAPPPPSADPPSHDAPRADLDALVAAAEALLAAEDAQFDPASIVDARERVVAEIVRRRGQAAFRAALLQAYAGQCAMTGCNALETLEAAHIAPYKGPATNVVSNGLLLRADVHTLFDLGLVAVDCETQTLLVAPRLVGTPYEELAGRPLQKPTPSSARPSDSALHAHRRSSGL